jgi:hypothetical protein
VFVLVVALLDMLAVRSVAVLLLPDTCGCRFLSGEIALLLVLGDDVFGRAGAG